MKRIIKWLEASKSYLEDDYDLIVPVIGDEGSGKSTLIMEIGWLWLDILGAREQTVENCMNQIAWDQDQFKSHIGSKPQYSLISVHDAARVLSRKKAMHGDQIEIEEDLLDMRFGNYLVLLGFQEFDLLPTMLATRRSKILLRIPERGIVHGYNEDGIRKRYKHGGWPDPVLRDTFPSLEGKKLWEAFTSEDQRRKQERIRPDSDEEEMGAKEYADEIVKNGISDVVSINPQTGRPYIDKDMVQVEHGTSGSLAQRITKVLRKKVQDGEIDVEEVW